MFEVKVREGIATVQLNRPPVNALNMEFVDRLHEELSRLEGPDDRPRAIVFTSVLPVFCAGADISMMKDALSSQDGAQQMAGFTSRLQELYARVAMSPVPTIAAIGGAATGGGLELALACDLRVVASSAKLGLPEARIGVLPAAGGTQRLPILAGRGAAFRLMLQAELVTGDEAWRLGIAEWSVERDEVGDMAFRVARRIAESPADAISAIKSCVNSGAGVDGFALEVSEAQRLFANSETRELMTGFLAKR